MVILLIFAYRGSQEKTDESGNPAIETDDSGNTFDVYTSINEDVTLKIDVDIQVDDYW